MNQKEFEAKWHLKIVKPINDHYNIPVKEYVVTSALIGGEEIVFAIKALDYNLENKHWITFKLPLSDADKLDSGFEAVRDGEEECKPKILHEAFLFWVDQGDDNWQLITRSIGEDGVLGDLNYSAVSKKDIPRVKAPCVEYLTVYSSIYDLGRPSCYIENVPTRLTNDESFSELKIFINKIRKDILAGKVAYEVRFAGSGRKNE